MGSLLMLFAPLASASQLQGQSPIWLRVSADQMSPKDRPETIEAVGLALGVGDPRDGTLDFVISILPGEVLEADGLSAAENAWSGGLKFRQYFGCSLRADAYVSVMAGFLAGDRVGEGDDNLVMPFARLGFGFQYMSREIKGNRIVFSPEIGFFPGVLYTGEVYDIASPSVSASVGLMRR